MNPINRLPIESDPLRLIVWQGVIEGKKYVGIKVANRLIVQLHQDWKKGLDTGNIFSLDGKEITVLANQNPFLIKATKECFRKAIPRPTEFLHDPFKQEMENFIKKYNILTQYRPLFIQAISHVLKTKMQLIKQKNSIVSQMHFDEKTLTQKIQPGPLIETGSKAALTFAEMTRRIPPNQWADVQKTLEDLSVEEDFMAAVNKGDIQAMIACKDYALQALKALEQGLITKEVFSTIQMSRTTMECIGKDNVKVITLFIGPDKELNPEAERLIEETLVARKTHNYNPKQLFPKESLRLLTKEELWHFLKEIKTKPTIEQQFLVYSGNDQSSFQTAQKDITITSAITFNSGLNALFRCNNGIRMVPSFSMMQTFLKERYGENAIKINPVIAISSVSDIMNNGMTDSRDMALSIPGAPLLDNADGYKAIGPDFFLHDFYHAITVSSAPSQHRALFIHLAAGLKQAIPYLPKKEKKAANKLIEHIIDLELTLHAGSVLLTGKALFSSNIIWETLETFMEIEQIATPHRISDKTKNKLFSTARNTLTEEELSLMGSPDQLLLRQEHEFLQILTKHIEGSSVESIRKEAENFYKSLEEFSLNILPEMIKQESSSEEIDQEKAHILKPQFIADYISTYWAPRVGGEIASIIGKVFVSLRQSPLKPIITARSWTRDHDDKPLFSPLMKENYSVNENLAAALAKLDRGPSSSDEHLSFLKKQKEKFDNCIIEAFIDEVQGRLALGSFYSFLETVMGISSETGKSIDDLPIEIRIRQIAFATLFYFLKDKKSIAMISLFLVKYKNLVESHEKA